MRYPRPDVEADDRERERSGSQRRVRRTSELRLFDSVFHTLLVKATDGWYTSQAIEKIKIVLRHKFFQLLQGHIATEEECGALLNEPPSKATMKSRAPKLRIGKHNMAKGALPPEELAVRVGP